jgi:nickel-dependent lactate racemase
MRIDFPYPNSYVDVPEANLMGIYALPDAVPAAGPASAGAVVGRALAQPIGTPRLRDLARSTTGDAASVLVVCDDVSRPTPAFKIVPSVIEELHAGGIADEQIAFMMALGTHRPMTEDEIETKLGAAVCARYPVYNHEWDNPDALAYVGATDFGVEVWINKRVAEADLVVGVGRIMPIEVSGFTGGGKILVPGCCGEITNSEMHWVRAGVDGSDVIGKRDNPIRAAIDSLARQAGLDFIVNVIMDAGSTILDCVAGDLVEAHREGVRRCRTHHEVHIPHEADIVIVDGCPFDIEFWQVNKAVDTAGLVVRRGGAVICVSPCYEGFSRTHADVLLQYGYRPRAEVERLVTSGRIAHKVVGVHMLQVGEVAVEKATLYLVTDGISPEDVERVGLRYAATPQQALDQSLAVLGPDAGRARVAVLRGAAEMLPIVGA